MPDKSIGERVASWVDELLDADIVASLAGRIDAAIAADRQERESRQVTHYCPLCEAAGRAKEVAEKRVTELVGLLKAHQHHMFDIYLGEHECIDCGAREGTPCRDDCDIAAAIKGHQ